jgi:hypothetical protein
MPPGKRKSISSMPMEPSKHSEAVIALGKRLVEELGLEPGVDTLGRWMAHYIAELIKKAEETGNSAERRMARKRCCEAILRLWKHRSSLPHGARPLANLESVLKAIENLRGNKTPWLRLAKKEVERTAGPWMAFAQVVEESGLRMCRLAVLMAIAERAFGKEKRWLRHHKEMLSKGEIRVIQNLDSWLSGGILWRTSEDRVSIGDLEPDERFKMVLSKIEASIKQLNEAFESLRNGVQ